MSYTHLTLEERYCLVALQEKGASIRAIARILGRSASTISRELTRNRNKKRYHPYDAHSKAVHRRRIPRRSALQMDPEKLQYTVTKLEESDWSPEEIAGRWELEHPGSKISCSTIYRHIKRGLLPGITRKHHLRRHGKKKVHRKSNYNTIQPDRIIPEWPLEIRDRMRIGDWEGDTIQGAKGKGGAVTLVDRKSGYLCGHVVQTRGAGENREAIVAALDGLPVFSLSLDNGSEFAEFRLLESQLGAPIFFAEPHKPWQRGCNENANGLLRSYFHKGCDFRYVSSQEFDRIVSLINHRPRKRLGWRTPFEVFFGVALT